MGRQLEAVDRLDLDTEFSIRSLCREYGITASRYFELSDMNSPTTVRPMSYVTFGRAMSGLPVTEEHDDMLARSLLIVRQELRRLKCRPLAESLLADVEALLRLWSDDPDVLSKHDLSTLRSIVRRALARDKQH